MLTKKTVLKQILVFCAILASAVISNQVIAQEKAEELNPEDITLGTAWEGKRVGFLGDSMTDPRNTSAKTHYWTFLHHLLGIEPHVYARSGYEWKRLLDKAKEMNQEMGDSIDAIIIWCGTNDYNQSREIGEFYTDTVLTVNVNGKMLPRKHRTWIYDGETFCGTINSVMRYLKTTYPTKQIIIMTPIHRGLANFNEKNVQPDEDYANGQGLYLESYIEKLKEAAMLWAVPVIDLHSVSGIYPNLDSNTQYISKEATDRLHPNSAGHYRIARTIQHQLMALPPTF